MISLLLSAAIVFHPVTLPACTIEDASSGPVPCVWLATSSQAQGNGTGHSFRVWRNGNATYISQHAAKRLLGLL